MENKALTPETSTPKLTPGQLEKLQTEITRAISKAGAEQAAYEGTFLEILKKYFEYLSTAHIESLVKGALTHNTVNYMGHFVSKVGTTRFTKEQKDEMYAKVKASGNEEALKSFTKACPEYTLVGKIANLFKGGLKPKTKNKGQKPQTPEAGNTKD